MDFGKNPCEVCENLHREGKKKELNCDNCDVEPLHEKNQDAFEIVHMLPDIKTATVNEIDVYLDLFYIDHPAIRLEYHQKISAMLSTIKDWSAKNGN